MRSFIIIYARMFRSSNCQVLNLYGDAIQLGTDLSHRRVIGRAQGAQYEARVERPVAQVWSGEQVRPGTDGGRAAGGWPLVEDGRLDGREGVGEVDDILALLRHVEGRRRHVSLLGGGGGVGRGGNQSFLGLGLTIFKCVK